MKRKVMFAVAAILIIAGCHEVAPEQAAIIENPTVKGPVVFARLPEVSGDVNVTSKGIKTAAHKNHELLLRDHVRAGSKAKALLLYLDQAKVQLRENAEVEIRSKGLRVRRGSTWFNVVQRGTEFVVDIPGGTLAVLGTSFGVEVAEDGTTNVRLAKGSLQVRTRKGKQPLSPGDSAVIDSYGAVRYTSATSDGVNRGKAKGDLDILDEHKGGMGSGGLESTQ